MADYDVIVVGSGLGGLTAGLFAARHGLSTLILEVEYPRWPSDQHRKDRRFSRLP